MTNKTTFWVVSFIMAVMLGYILSDLGLWPDLDDNPVMTEIPTAEVLVVREVVERVVTVTPRPATPTATPTITRTPAPTQTPTATPTEAPTLTAYEISRTATAEYVTLASRYTLVEKYDFLNRPWDYEGQLIALRGEYYEYADSGYTIQLWVATGGAYDFVNVYLSDRVGVEFSKGYQYYAYGLVVQDDYWDLGYGLEDAFLSKQVPPNETSTPEGTIIQHADGALFQLQLDDSWARISLYTSGYADGSCPEGYTHQGDASVRSSKSCKLVGGWFETGVSSFSGPDRPRTVEGQEQVACRKYPDGTDNGHCGGG